MKISIGKQTDVGCVREANEDSFYVELPQEGAPQGGTSQGAAPRKSAGSPGKYALLLVADGMGGQVAGKEASETAVEVVKALFAAKAKTGKPLKDIKKFILDAFREANQAVFKKGEAQAANMGTTLTTAFIDNQNAYIGHVGDSRAYLLREREIRQLTEDHSLAEDMVKKGKATREEVKKSPMRSMLTRSIGTKKEVAVDEPIGIELEDGDCLVLCTDGLTNLVEDQEILSVVHNTADLQKACNKLADMARKRGGHDNITIVAAEFGALERIKGLGIKAKTVVVKSVKGVKKKRFLIAAIGLLVAIFMLLTYLLVSHYRGQDRFYQTPTTEQGAE
jgi:serine/threonine protein phosphatase PrpC